MKAFVVVCEYIAKGVKHYRDFRYFKTPEDAMACANACNDKSLMSESHLKVYVYFQERYWVHEVKIEGSYVPPEW